MKQDLVAKLSDTQPEAGLPKRRDVWVEDSKRWKHLSLQDSSAVGGDYRSQYNLTLNTDAPGQNLN